MTGASANTVLHNRWRSTDFSAAPPPAGCVQFEKIHPDTFGEIYKAEWGEKGQGRWVVFARIPGPIIETPKTIN